MLPYRWRKPSLAKEKFQQAALTYEEADRLRPGDPAILNAWGISLARAGQYKPAEMVYSRALDLREKMLDPEHPDLATTINEFAVLLHMEGENARAEPLYRRALDIREKRLGPWHPDVAETRRANRQLAVTYFRQSAKTKDPSAPSPLQ